MLLDTAGRDNNAITAAIAAADLILIPCHPPGLELSTLEPTFARLRADQKEHYVLLIDMPAGAVRCRADAAAIERAGAGRTSGLHLPLRLPRGAGARAGRHRVPARAGCCEGDAEFVGVVARRDRPPGEVRDHGGIRGGNGEEAAGIIRVR